ncbi:MAG: c-type cytochrome [Dehalococcoidia bacterium]
MVGPAGSERENVALGAGLYAANCQVCHGDSSGRGGTGGAPPHNEIGHTWHHPDAQLKDWVLNGKPGFATPGMPPLGDKLTEPEVDAVLSYIKTWWTSKQRESQADVSRRYQEALDKQKKKQWACFHHETRRFLRHDPSVHRRSGRLRRRESSRLSCHTSDLRG